MRTRLSRFNIAAARRFVYVPAALALFASAAMAQTSTTTFLPYADLASGGKTEVSAAAGAFAPVVIGLLVGMVCLGLLFIWLKKGAKST